MKKCRVFAFFAVFFLVFSLPHNANGKVKMLLNQPPKGFVALFNGIDLTGWKGLVANPPQRAKMSKDQLAQAQSKADEQMRKNWKVVDGALIFDSHGSHLCTVKDYGDFELLVDWKIEAKGDSGLYLRGSPQVQIWDPIEWKIGSGGLYNNQKNPSEPMSIADNPLGEWNTFRIIMVGEKVTIFLNDTLVVDDVTLENYWQRDKPIYSTGQIELQSHGSKLAFRNIFIRELPKSVRLFDGKTFAGWTVVGGSLDQWTIKNGILKTSGKGGGWISTDREYKDYELSLDFKVPSGSNSGVFIRSPHASDPAYAGIEVQVLDDNAKQYANLKPYQYTGSLYGVEPPAKRVSKPADCWQTMTIRVEDSKVQVTLNNEKIIDTDVNNYPDKFKEHPGLKRRSGYIGLQSHSPGSVEYRNIRIRELFPQKQR